MRMSKTKPIIVLVLALLVAVGACGGKQTRPQGVGTSPSLPNPGVGTSPS